jgi:pimeloyl-ACP methyl ester carboxylesterase
MAGGPLQLAYIPSPRRLPDVRLLILVLLLTLLTACNASRDYDAVLLISDVAAGTAPTRLKSVTAQPVRTPVTLPAAGKTIRGDLYLPAQKPLAGILLLPGAAETGKDDPRLQAFANSMTRMRFAVLVPDLEDFRSLQVSSNDITEVADSFAWLAARKDLAPDGRAGIISFSYASGPAILAALSPRTGGRVRFMMTVGGYYNLRDVLTFFTTGYYLDQGKWRHMEPNSYGKWVFVLSNLGRLSDPIDRELFRQAAQRKMADLNAPLHDLTTRLPPEGKSLYDFLENRDRARAATLMDRLPAQIRSEIRALNLAEYDLSQLKARMILVHGYDDDIIPYTESVALAKRVPQGKARLYLVYGLKHVNLQPRMVDKFRLWRAMSALLQERER